MTTVKCVAFFMKLPYYELVLDLLFGISTVVQLILHFSRIENMGMSVCVKQTLILSDSVCLALTCN